jgi:predicted AlkP superfamily pyrophosphatase or phosphodiesterase
MVARTASKVLVVGMDGVRIDRVLQPAAAPVVQELIARGALGTSLLPYGVPGDVDGVTDLAYTDSAPGWTSIATGVWPDKHGVMNNDSFAAWNAPAYPDFVTRARAAGSPVRAATFLSWEHLGRYATFGAASALCHRSDGDRDGYEGCDADLVVEAARCLRETDLDLVVVYLGFTDETAHQHGPLGSEFRQALLTQDRQLGVLLDAVAGRPDRAREQWTVIVTTDHGHRDEGGHGGVTDAERTVFVLVTDLDRPVTGARLREPRLVDIAPTVLDRLAVTVDPAWDLDGVRLSPR